jgi:hypothetical protein
VPVLAAIGCNDWSARRCFLPLWQVDAEVVLLKADVLRTKLDCLNHDGRASTGMSPSAFAMARLLTYEAHTKSFSKVQLSHAFGIRPRQALPRA